MMNDDLDYGIDQHGNVHVKINTGEWITEEEYEERFDNTITLEFE